MSELVTWVFAALNGFCAVWKLARNQESSPNGSGSGVAEVVRVVSGAPSTDMVNATALAAARACNRLLMFPLPREM